MPAHEPGPRPHLTTEQDEQRLRGLRALARLIVRAHLARTAAGPAGNGASPDRGGEPPREEDRDDD